MSAHTSSASPGTATTTATQPPTPRQTRRILLAVLAAVFTALFSGTVVFPALPAITSDFDSGTIGLTWVVTAVLLANATSTPVWGTLSDRHDPKVLIKVALLILVAGSAAATCAPTMSVLLVGRALQGIGTGGVVTVAVAVLGAIIPPREQGRYSGYVGVVIAAALAGSPLLGGILVDSPLGWRACFLACAPPAALALLALRRLLPPAPHGRPGARIDWLGAALLTSGVTLLAVWITVNGHDHQCWTSWTSNGSLAVAVTLLAAATVIEHRARVPVVPVDLLCDRTAACAILSSVAAGLGFYATQSFLAAYLQSARSHSATDTGLLLTPMVIGLALSSVVSGRLITKFGTLKVFLVIGALLQLIGCSALTQLDHTTALWQIEVAVLCLGLGIGMLLQNLVLAVQNTVLPDRIGAASGAVLYFRSIGGAVGLPILAAALPAHSNDIEQVFLILVALAAASLLVVILLPNHPLRTAVELSRNESTPRSDHE